jgi:hypothetical protein
MMIIIVYGFLTFSLIVIAPILFVTSLNVNIGPISLYAFLVLFSAFTWYIDFHSFNNGKPFNLPWTYYPFTWFGKIKEVNDGLLSYPSRLGKKDQ